MRFPNALNQVLAVLGTKDASVNKSVPAALMGLLVYLHVEPDIQVHLKEIRIPRLKICLCGI